ncbi:MAG: hypothetical protein EB127_03125 [Alphaproteobacteria bacterium]|nr:hypothetical protein [Alphaproteobacteria bacterium]
MALDNIGGVGGLVSILLVSLLAPLAFFGIYYSTLLPSEQEALVDWLGKLVGWQSPLATLSSLLTYFIFLAGPITDVVSQQYRYSIASIVSLFGVIITKIFNSSQFYEFSQYFISPVVPAYWGLTADSLAIWSVLFRFLTFPMALLIVALIATPTALATTGNSKYANITASVISVLTGLITLSGFELIGKPLTAAQKAAIEEAKQERIKQRASEKSIFEETKKRVTAERKAFSGAPSKSEAESIASNLQLGGSSYVKIDPASPDGLCDIPGTGSFFSNTLAPPSIIITQTIIWCHLIEQWDTKSTSEGSTGLIITSLLTFGLQWLTLNSAGCLENGKYIYGSYSPLISLLLSIVFAGTAYGTLKVTEGFTPETKLREHMGVFSNPPQEPSSKDKSKIKVGDPAEKNLPLNDEDQFVCEAYKDGELVTSTLVG